MTVVRALGDPEPGSPDALELATTQAQGQRSSATQSLGVHRTISLVATLGLLWPLFVAWNDIIGALPGGLASVPLTGSVLWLAGAIATAKTESRLVSLDRWLLVLGLLVLACNAAAVLGLRPGYGTDEAAFEQGAAAALLHGHDPYRVNLAHSLYVLGTPSTYFTYKLTGGIVNSFGYPALPVLVAAVFVKLTGGNQTVPIADVFVLMLATVAVFKMLPRDRRGAAVILCVGFPMLSTLALSGLNETLAMALLIPVAFRWTSTAQTGALSRADRLRAVCFGLALATNQLTWFIAPFLLGGIYLLRSGPLGARQARRVTLTYLGLAVAVFAVINAPFFIWGPVFWLRGVAAPLVQHAIPFGQGSVTLTLFLRMGGGAVDFYDYAAACLYLAVLVVYLVRFRTLARACFLLPLAALFFSGRSLAGYWMSPVAVIAVGALTSQERQIALAAQLAAAARRGVPRMVGRAMMPALFLPAVVCLAVALASPQPLTMRVLIARNPGGVGSVSELLVSVHNRSDGSLRPHFAVNITGHAVLWRIARGPSVLGPRRSGVYRLIAPNALGSPPLGAPFVLQAFTSSPRTISSTGQIRPRVNKRA